MKFLRKKEKARKLLEIFENELQLNLKGLNLDSSVRVTKPNKLMSSPKANNSTNNINKILKSNSDITHNKSPERSFNKENFRFSSKNYFLRKYPSEKEKLNLNLENYYSYNYLPMKVNLTNNFPMNSNEFCDSNNKFNSPHNDSLGNKNGFFAKNRVAFNMFNNCISNSNSKYNIYSSSINENLSTKSTSPINFDLKPNYEKLSYSNKNLNLNLSRKCSQNEETNSNNKHNNNNFNKQKNYRFVERQGDWICIKCKNLNFSFRVICNRCKLPKSDTQQFYDEHIKGLMNIVVQNQIITGNVNNNPIYLNLNCNAIFSPDNLYKNSNNCNIVSNVSSEETNRK